MGTVTFYSGSRYGVNSIYLAEGAGEMSASRFEVLDGNNIVREVNIGSGFLYGYNNFFYSGTINSVYSFSTTGELIWTVTGINLDVATRNSTTVLGKSAGNYWGALLAGNDTISGSAQDDLIFGSTGADVVNGGGGRDLLSFIAQNYRIRVDLGAGYSDLVNLYSDTYTRSTVRSIEDVQGSKNPDRITGSSGDNEIQGMGGNDVLAGGLGFDTVLYLDATAAVTVNLATGGVSGGSGSDTISGFERVVGSRFADTITGGSGNDIINPYLGNDLADGGAGIDTLDYSNGTGTIRANLGQALTIGAAGIDVTRNFENVIGSAFGDFIYGSAAANTLAGRLGADTLTGAGGNDVFLFDTTPSSSNRDTIVDFSKTAGNSDRIHLDDDAFTAFAKVSTPTPLALGAFRAGSAAADSSDRIIYNQSTGALYYDADGSGPLSQVQFALVGTSTPHPGLGAGDFLVVS